MTDQGIPGWGQQATPGPDGPATLVRTYKGKLDEATRAFQIDAANLAQQGYTPTNQMYTPGSWGCGAFLLALLLFLILVGILVFIYMILVKPAGTLTVTYTKQVAPPAPAAG